MLHLGLQNSSVVLRLHVKMSRMDKNQASFERLTLGKFHNVEFYSIGIKGIQ